ncbi:MAG: hypothetical protein HKN50_01770 [Gammaproteobacteria bacterium]|nr:hypothetical protein [Gammaproteobacteria bacterium]
MNLQINPELDIEQIAANFQSQGKIRIDNFLTTESAESILDCLKNYTAWHLAYSDAQGQPVRLDSTQVAQLSQEQEQQIMTELHQRASANYQYMYKFFPIIDAIKDGLITDNSMLYEIATFLNNTAFIKTARQITGVNTLVKMDPQATLYERNHFLNMHDDMGDQRETEDSSVRRFAVVLGFTKNWSYNWGGQTNFFDGVGAAAAESWYPCFNSLTIFQVPRLHSVGYVTPFADKGRYSLTGWLRDDPTVIREDLEDN